MAKVETPWGGRFGEAPDALMERFNASIGFDRKLLEVDIAGSAAYARGLERAGIISTEERTQIEVGLEKVRQEFAQPDCDLPAALEAAGIGSTTGDIDFKQLAVEADRGIETLH